MEYRHRTDDHAHHEAYGCAVVPGHLSSRLVGDGSCRRVGCGVAKSHCERSDPDGEGGATRRGTVQGGHLQRLVRLPHRRSHPRRAAYPHSRVRTERTVNLFRRSGIDVAGLQELQRSARRKFRTLAPEYGMFEASTRSVVWRKDDFTFIDGHTIRTRTYHGRLARTPVVTLRQRATGHHLVVMSVHNPADVRGPAAAFRDEATQQELAEVLRHRHAADPVPVVVLGDMNAQAKFFCAFTESGDMHAAAGGSHVGGVCDPPSFTKGIDWIMGSTDVAFSRFRDDYDTRLATDHPLITAVARITS
jgi:endonuclease/exonuclease/phosphatase family metal-dependent hydrolase